MMRKFVLDTSALYEGKTLPEGEGVELFTTPECAEEMKKKNIPNIEFLLETRIMVLSPSDAAARTVESKAEKLGEADRLSPEDKSAIELALDKKAVLLTDDYSIQNICSSLGVEFSSTWTKGIKEVWEWKYRCTGCGRYYDRNEHICHVCGSPLKPVRAQAPTGDAEEGRERRR